MMRCTLFIVLALTLLYVAPSHQYGTMFTDNITEGLTDNTFFGGIKTKDSFTTHASIGKLNFNTN